MLMQSYASITMARHAYELPQELYHVSIGLISITNLSYNASFNFILSQINN